ncbi:filamentous haemagglutinin family protein [Bradyrhizobium sp. CB2312]|uniref:filamentous haemagglutinin family protein n=1 Tax=Bradyrhizobium sp. CB2312 TaxID=3039155 RepID=UPI0024B15CC6|nr:filamentous haemagglutinin family protein [Bradyrhizobium sp. CB2312]WFU69641.1 filamentous hemagglutinin family protein [Bradyrhizobium sp. CB2312]
MSLRNGGALDVNVGGAVRGGQLYVGRGDGSIFAGEFAVGRSVTITDTANAATTFTYSLAPVLALGDATMSVTTAGDLRLQTVLDPLMAGTTSMSGYTERTALDLTSVGGNAILVNQGKYISKALSISVLDHCCVTADESYQWFTTKAANLYPSNTRITALNGNVQIPVLVSPSINVMSNRLSVMPGSHPELQILAGGSVLLNGAVLMAHATAAMLPSPFLPTAGGTQNADFQAGLVTDGATTGIDDTEPSRIYARTGSILAVSQIVTSEQTWFRAGTDIRNNSLLLRNLNRTDVSMLEAGNDIIPNGISIQGPGALLLSAGRDVYGVAPSIQSTGLATNQVIAGQSTEGAGISILAGLRGKQPAYGALIAAYLDPANVADMPDYLKASVGGAMLPIYLLPNVETRKNGNIHILHEGVAGFVARVTGEVLSPLDAWVRFKTLPALTQQRFLREVYMEELRAAGNDQNTLNASGQPVNGGYNRGYAAIATLFPGSGWSGDAKFGNVVLRTNFGGDIDILTPGGGFQAASLTATVGNGNGVVTLGFGNINIFARNDVVVNQSRILTFGGGDDIIWSTLGDIDAGRGAKTARSVSAPIVTTDVNANTMVTERADISGSGIGTVVAYAGVTEGDVDLIAPKGTVNAGDAGIRASGNLNVAALFVLNVDNIKVGGETKGVPKPVSVVAPLTVETKDRAAADAAKDATQQSSSGRPSVIIVEVLGYGGASGDSEGERREEQPKRNDKRSSIYDVNSSFQVLGNGALSEEKKRYLTDEERRGLP